MKKIVGLTAISVMSFLSGMYINMSFATDRLERINSNVSEYVANAQHNQNTVDACYGVVTNLIVENVKQKKIIGIDE